MTLPTVAASLFPLQILHPLHRAKSSPIPVPLFLPLGPGIPVSHVLSVRLQAPLRPAQLFLPPPLLSSSSQPTPSTASVCISLNHLGPQRALHFFYRPLRLHFRFPVPPLPLSESQLIVCAVLWHFLAWFVLLLISNVVSPLSHRCKEGYHGLRCDQFVPKTDAILSDPSTPSFSIFSSSGIDLGHRCMYMPMRQSLTASVTKININQVRSYIDVCPLGPKTVCKSSFQGSTVQVRLEDFVANLVPRVSHLFSAVSSLIKP